MKKHRKSSFSRRLRMERLESRFALAVNIAIGIDLDGDGNADDVRIVGGTENTLVRIDDEGVGQGSLTIDVDKNGDGDFLDAGDILDQVLNIADDSSIIELRLGAGNDRVEYMLTDNLDRSVRHVSVDLGAGNDVFQYSSDSKNIQTLSRLVVDVLAGGGADTLDMLFDNIVNSEVVVSAILGTGNDTAFLDFSAASVDLGATVQADIDLGSGTNTFRSEMFVTVGTQSQGTVDIDVTGGLGVDILSGVFLSEIGNGTNPSRLSFDADLGGGNDISDWLIDLLEPDVNSLAQLSFYGRDGNDNMRTEFVGGQVDDVDGVLDIDFEGGRGNDTITADLNGSSPFDVTGQIRLHVNGNEGTDVLKVDLEVSTISTGNLDLVVLAGAGNDTVTFNLLKGGAPVTLGRTGKVVLDGGLGTDTLDNNAAAGIVDAKFFELFI